VKKKYLTFDAMKAHNSQSDIRDDILKHKAEIKKLEEKLRAIQRADKFKKYHQSLSQYKKKQKDVVGRFSSGNHWGGYGPDGMYRGKTYSTRWTPMLEERVVESHPGYSRGMVMSEKRRSTNGGQAWTLSFGDGGNLTVNDAQINAARRYERRIEDLRARNRHRRGRLS
jgi:hypothetical protein